jgi:hypothetical protein
MSRAERLTDEKWAVIELLLSMAERRDGRGRLRMYEPCGVQWHFLDIA